MYYTGEKDGKIPSIFERITNHFKWSKWERVWEQLDEYKNTVYELFRSTNLNWLNRYKKIKVISSSCYTKDVIVK